MPLAKRFKLGLASWFSTPPASDAQDEGTDRKPVDSSHDIELRLWERAIEAVQQRAHYPSPGDALIPWHGGPECADVCTVEPAPRTGRATLFLRTTLAALDLARRLDNDFFKALNLTVEAIADKKTKAVSPGSTPSGVEKATTPSKVVLSSKAGAVVLKIEASRGDSMYGNVLTLTSTILATQEALEYLQSIFPPGYACVMPHDVTETVIGTARGAMMLVKRTGVEKKGISAEKLGTIFELKDDDAPKFESPKGHQPPRGLGDRVVARCVVGYRDASRRPSLGPTIQSIAVRTDYQGIGLVQDIFNAVEGWFVECWALDTLFRNRMLKATQLQDFVVDRAPGGEGVPSDQTFALTDKIFWYEVMNFSYILHPNDPKGKAGTRVPPEAHAVKYYPQTGTIVPLPTVYYSYPSKTRGWRSCDNCRVPEELLHSKLLVCGNCKLPAYWRAHYCSRKCQKEDWSLHKLWCGKSYAEVCAGKKTFEETLKLPAP